MFSKSSKHIGIHYNAVRGGGAPNIVRNQIEYLLKHGYRVTLISERRLKDDNLSRDRFKVVEIEKESSGGRYGFFSRSLAVRRNLKALNLDLLISHSVRHGTRLGLLSIMLPMKHIIVEHAHPPTTLAQLKFSQRLTLKWLLTKTRLICVSKGAASSLSNLLSRPVGYIYNYAPSHTIADKFRGLSRKNVVIGIGRFEQEKRFNLLIDAFDTISHSFPDWELHLYGRGRQHELLVDCVRNCRYPDRIKIFDWCNEPLKKLGEAKIFAQTSQYEGFGLAMVEAMAVGTPVISFSCPFGPSEIVRNGEDGVLVEELSRNSFSDCLLQLMSDANFRRQLEQSSPSVVDRFSKEKHVSSWIREIESLV